MSTKTATPERKYSHSQLSREYQEQTPHGGKGWSTMHCWCCPSPRLSWPPLVFSRRTTGLALQWLVAPGDGGPLKKRLVAGITGIGHVEHLCYPQPHRQVGEPPGPIISPRLPELITGWADDPLCGFYLYAILEGGHSPHGSINLFRTAAGVPFGAAESIGL